MENFIFLCSVYLLNYSYQFYPFMFAIKILQFSNTCIPVITPVFHPYCHRIRIGSPFRMFH